MSPDDKRILLAHGAGGELTRQLMDNIFLKYFGNEVLKPLADAAVLDLKGCRLAFSTDSFVVRPLFFPGGDIGKLAVCGTVNDLAVSGARALFLTASFIIEEGLPLNVLEQITRSLGETCRAAGVQVVAGDTKVVEKGHGDLVFINTAGIGVIPEGLNLGQHRLLPGDVAIVNGPMGNHGLAVLLAREQLGLESGVISDCAPLNGIIARILAIVPGVKMMRDLTRGGLATAVKEIALGAGVDILLEEPSIPVDDEVRGALEILGLDPLYMANEGKFVVFVAPKDAPLVMKIMAGDPLGGKAAIIGRVAEGKGNVLLKTGLGGTKILDLLAGDPLPRIC
ncbi:MAG: hydrogenase expression/formation protein HypE [Bacillota bacterium]